MDWLADWLIDWFFDTYTVKYEKKEIESQNVYCVMPALLCFIDLFSVWLILSGRPFCMSDGLVQANC